MEYTFNRKLMITNLIVCVILIVLVIRTEGMDVITQKTNIINCPEDSNIDCTFINEEGKIVQFNLQNLINAYNEEGIKAQRPEDYESISASLIKTIGSAMWQV